MTFLGLWQPREDSQSTSDSVTPVKMGLKRIHSRSPFTPSSRSIPEKIVRESKKSAQQLFTEETTLDDSGCSMLDQSELLSDSLLDHRYILPSTPKKKVHAF